MKSPIIIFFSLLFFTFQSFGQNFSNKGKDFWVAYGYHVRMGTSAGGSASNSQDMVLYFATEGPTTITIDIPGVGYTQTLTSGPLPTVLTSNPIPKTGSQDVRLLTESTNPENKGIHITATREIVAYAHNYNQSVSGATILFPTSTLGKEYYSINYTNNSNENNSNCWFYVVATDTGTTTVEITPSANTINHAAGVPFTVNLTQGQVYNIMGQLTGTTGGGGGGGGAFNLFTGVDLTGSKIKSIASGTGVCKRIAVFSGSGKINITCGSTTGSNSADNYMVQAFPKDAWGKKFLTVPTRSLNNNIYRVCVLDPLTQVKLNGLPIAYPLINNFYYEIPATTSPLKIESDLPITVAQYIATQGACGNSSSNTNPGDPEVIYLSPVEQNISKVLWNATPNFNITQHYYNVVIPNRGTAISSFRLDGAAINPALFNVHPQEPNYSYLSAQLSSSGVHTIESDSGFNAIAYGFGSAESYGYNAGTNIKDLYNLLEPLNPLSLTTNPVACTGSPFYYTVTFPFQPTYLYFDYHGNPLQTPNSNTTLNNPVADSTYFIGGKQVWRYKLPILYNISLANNSPGYLVSVTAGTTSSEGCGNSTTKDFYLAVYDPPSAAFSWTNNGCITDTVRFTDTTLYQPGTYSYKWYWDFGDGIRDSIHNPSHRYQNPGTYLVKFMMISNVGCLSDTAYRTVVVTAVPIPGFNTSLPICQGSSITFNNTSSLAQPGSIVNTYWNFGDGTTQITNSSNPGPVSHIYNATGTYPASIWMETNTGCKSIIDTNLITVGAYPIAGFIDPEVCLSDTYAQFTDTSHIASGNITNWQWDFGDIVSGPLNTSVITNPSHSYSTTGVKDVTLVVTSDLGCKDTVMQSFFVNGDIPRANIQVLNSNAICATDSVRIKDLSTVNVGNIVKVEIYWDVLGSPSVFETDNSPNFGKIYSHLYPNFQTPATQTYRIRFRSYSGLTCIDDYFQDIVLYAVPRVQFNTIPDTCLYISPFQITQASEIGGVPGSFSFSGPGISSSGIFNPAAVGPGTYTLHYTYTSLAGCKDSAVQQITVLDPPIANFGISAPQCERNSISFHDSSFSTNQSIVNWIWNFGDGSPSIINSSNATVSHTYASSGNYTATLQVMTSGGCNSAVKVKNIIINPLPVAVFNFSDTACLPNAKVVFVDQSTIPNGTQNTFTYQWNFGDPTSGSQNQSTVANPFHYFGALGPYNVTLAVTSGAGCTDDTTMVVNTIHPQPQAHFIFNKPSVCIGDIIGMIDQSDPLDGSVLEWHWDFGDGTNSVVQNPVHLYNAPAVYSPSLYIVNSYGCHSDTVSNIFNVYAYPNISAGPDLYILEGDHQPLQATAFGNNLQYLWTSATFLSNPTILNPICSPVNDINYLLTVTGIGGCTSTDGMAVKILKKPLIPNTFSPNNDGINDLWEIEYLKYYPFVRVQVFTRTGQLVFESKGYNQPWNGTKNGSPLPMDTYYYIIEPGSGRLPITGYVTLIK